MATQGVVSVCKNGRVVMKFIAGKDGGSAVTLAAAIRAAGEAPASVKEGYKLAKRHEFGSKATLVVMDSSAVEFRGGCDLDDLYRETFSRAVFNPRCEDGTADYVEVVHLK